MFGGSSVFAVFIGATKKGPRGRNKEQNRVNKEQKWGENRPFLGVVFHEDTSSKID